jgi:hypothetical protein
MNNHHRQNYGRRYGRQCGSRKMPWVTARCPQHRFIAGIGGMVNHSFVRAPASAFFNTIDPSWTFRPSDRVAGPGRNQNGRFQVRNVDSQTFVHGDYRRQVATQRRQWMRQPVHESNAKVTAAPPLVAARCR